ncbi:MAG: hypothetical protein ONA90_09965, partial [candidate division KSB1 bacterium]|nr:hypothetical protein [candidate division KSB1 bacterium]
LLQKIPQHSHICDMNSKIPQIFLLLAALALILSGRDFAQENPKTQKLVRFLGSNQTPGTYGMININNWIYFLEANGRSGYSPFQSGNGGIFPKGTSVMIFQDGFLFGASLIDTRTNLPPAFEQIRLGGQTYNQGMVPGAVPGGVPEDPNDPGVRLYRIRRDYHDPEVDLREDAAIYFNKHLNETTHAEVAALRALYDKDWREWPVHKGAPYIDRNGNGQYDPPPAGATSRELIARGYDEPGIASADPNTPADQVLWTVCNDFNEAASRSLFGFAPIGMELQITVWAYKRTDALSNVVFKKFRLINRGFFRSDSFFVAQWSDPDLGDFGDDLVGCDTLLNMAYAYNSNDVDREFAKFGLPPPAVGYDLLQGPIVPGAPTDTAIFDSRRIPGKKNMRMTSFAYQSAGSPVEPPSPPELGLRFWRMLQGYSPDPSTAPWRLYPHPPGVTPTKFPLSGDPVTQTGFY